MAGFLPYCLVGVGDSFAEFSEIKDVPTRARKIRSHYFKKQFNFRSIAEEKMRPVYEKHPEIFQSAGFGEFLFFELMQDGIYLWRALRQNSDGKYMALVVSVPGVQMQNKFLQQFYEKTEEGNKFQLCPLSDRDKSPESFLMSRREWKELYYRYYGRRDVLFDIHGGSRLATFLRSPVFTNHVFLFSGDKKEIYLPLSEMERYWHIFSFFYFLGILVLSFIATGILLAPVKSLISGFDRIKSEDFDFTLSHRGKDEGALVLKSFNSMVRELQMKKQMQPFVSGNLIRLFRGENTESHIISGRAAVLFSDIRSFTTISENHDARAVVDMLNDYFEIWSNIVEAHGGVIDKFIGDAVRVIFFEKTSSDYISNAVKAAVEMRKALVDFDAERYKSGLFEVENGIGIVADHIGFSVVGNEEKMEFLIMGGAGERAEFLESMTKNGRFTHIYVDEGIACFMSDVYEFAPVESEEEKIGLCFELKGLKV
jgi:adenylate cyclase